MFRATPRLIARPVACAALPRSIAPARRFLSTAPPAQKSRSWKSLVARLGLAGTIIYYYNTVDVFAEEPANAVRVLPEPEIESEHLQTIEAIAAERQKRKAVQAQLDAQAQKEAQSRQENAPPAGSSGMAGGIEGLGEEADQQGAFNPETGEINWDCPCLGGMATGPCGEEFKAAFSCFVFSEEEPKGMDCIDKFKDMQTCFRKYPEVYGSELDADAEDEEGDFAASELAPPSPEDSTAQTPAPQPEASRPTSTSSSERTQHHAPLPAPKTQHKPADTPSSSLSLVPDTYKPEPKRDEPVAENETLVPKAARDGRDANTKVEEKK